MPSTGQIRRFFGKRGVEWSYTEEWSNDENALMILQYNFTKKLFMPVISDVSINLVQM